MDSASSIESITLIIVGSRRIGTLWILIQLLRAVGSPERDLDLQSGLPHTIVGGYLALITRRDAYQVRSRHHVQVILIASLGWQGPHGGLYCVC